MTSPKPMSRLAQIETPALTRHVVPGGDDVPIAAFEVNGGGGGKRPVLLVHGFMQSHLSWHHQLRDPALTADRRVVALDLRGHGESGRALPEPAAPDLPPGYAPSWFADDVLAVIDGLALEDPVLVGWSYGGLVISDYVRTHGTGRIGGAVFVGAPCRMDPPLHEGTWIGPGFLGAAEMLSPELEACVRGTHLFLDTCFHAPLDEAEFAWMLAFNMAVPVPNRVAMLARGPERFDETVLPGLDRPVLVVHGAQDTVVLPASGEAIAAAVPGAELLRYERCAHTPFVEHPERFNADLLAFLERTG